MSMIQEVSAPITPLMEVSSVVGMTAFAPVLFADNFDGAVVNDLIAVGRFDGTQTPNGGTLALESTIVHTPGGKALKCTVPAYVNPDIPKASIYKSIYEWGEGTTLYADFWLRLATATNYTFLTFFDVEDPDYPGGLSPGFRLWFINSRLIRGAVEGEVTFLEQLAANQCPQDVYVHFQVELLMSDTAAGHCKVWRDGVLIMDGDIKTLPTGGSSQRVEVGASASNSTQPNTIYVDDLKVYNQLPYSSWPVVPDVSSVSAAIDDAEVLALIRGSQEVVSSIRAQTTLAGGRLPTEPDPDGS